VCPSGNGEPSRTRHVIATEEIVSEGLGPVTGKQDGRRLTNFSQALAIFQWSLHT
jgi:hypothetical protein